MIPLTKPKRNDNNTRPKERHWSCYCNLTVALCGTRVHRAFTDQGKATCVVCEDMKLHPCPRCGAGA